jgi:hypothetical protein
VNDQSSASPEGDVELFVSGIVKPFGIDVWKVQTMSLGLEEAVALFLFFM